MRVLGVTLSDRTDRARLERVIRETLRVRVIVPTDRVIAELDGGAKPATAYVALRRFVVPDALYHMHVWGLLCSRDVWADVDEAFSRYCEAVRHPAPALGLLRLGGPDAPPHRCRHGADNRVESWRPGRP